jgi:cobalt/nickel transport system permease protein
MRHHEIDQYAKQSPLYPFDPRVKLVSTILLIVAIALMQEFTPLLLVMAFLLILIGISRVPFGHVGKSFILALPFIVFASLALIYSSGYFAGLLMAMRISDSVLALLVLVSTTPFFDLLKALQWFKCPRIFSILLLFTYRFIFILIGEMDRMRMSRKARGFSGGKHIFDKGAMRTIGYTAGMTFFRSYKRAGNIYNALLSRGYTGEIKTLEIPRANARDAVFASAFIFMAVITLCLQNGVIDWKLFI